MSENTNDQPSAGTGLLDGVAADTPETTPNPESAQISHKAADSAPDTGAPKAKPEYLPDNFWNSDKGEADIEGMAKSWRDLRGKISKGAHNAPQDGKYDLSALEMPEDNPMAGTLVSWAKDNGISQAQFDELASKIRTTAQEVMGSEQIDPAAEMKKLGPNANAMVNGMVDWARGLVSKGVWSKDDFEEFKIMGGTARGIQALLKVREAYEGRVPIESQPLDGTPSKDELYAMVSDPKYKTDAAYRQKVERMFQANIK